LLESAHKPNHSQLAVDVDSRLFVIVVWCGMCVGGQFCAMSWGHTYDDHEVKFILYLKEK